ncbi:Orexin receptor type 2 [Mactra antiquata]
MDGTGSDEGDTALGIALNETNRSGTDNASAANITTMSPEDYIEYLKSHIYPTTGEWVLIFLYICTFFVGLIGNSLVCFSIIRNKNMRTITNIFIMNLSVADLAVILICLPLSLVFDVTSTWFFGTVGCCIYSFLSTFSINVSVLTLSAISVERWYAICHPLRFHSSIGRAKMIIGFIWIASVCAALPITVTSSSIRYKSYTVYFASCYPSMLSRQGLLIYQLCFILGLYVLPLALMAFAYIQIAIVLWKNQIPRQNLQRSRQPMLNSDHNQSENDGPIESRKKAARMLIAVVVVFAICYLPNHLLNLLFFTGIATEESMRQTIIISAMIAHWLVAFNSCINPIIYNFMSGKFRREFKNAIMVCVCCCCCSRQDDKMLNNKYRVSYTAATSRKTHSSNVERTRALETSSQIVLEQI